MNGSPAHHNLFFYGDDGSLVDQVVPFLSEGLANHEAVVIVLDPRKTALVRDALGRIGRRVASSDRDGYYTRPEDALAGYDARVRRYLKDGAPRVRVFGELPLCRTNEDSDTWILYEALLNPAFAHHPVTIVCGLDGRNSPTAWSRARGGRTPQLRQPRAARLVHRPRVAHGAWGAGIV